ncbi:MAG: signal peptidase I [Myxococcales bacterium]|nr:signal peptidase I [Myxococcales bacterium]MCB9524340.1 signal peptidase I [Myxococcales bacterium]
MTETKPPRPGKVRKQAKLALKRTRQLLKKHGGKISDAGRAEVQAAHDALKAAVEAKDADATLAGLDALERVVDARMGNYRKSPTREYFESIGTAVLIALLLRAFVVEAFTIPSGSMIPTLAVGDFLFVNKLAYGVRLPFADSMLTQWSQPERGDVVVFVYPCEKSLDYIKRVVGLPGDVITTDDSGFVLVNGQAIARGHAGEFSAYPEFIGSEPAQNTCTPIPLHVYPMEGDNGLRYGTLNCGAVQPARFPEVAPEAPVREWPAESQFRSCPSGRPPVAFPWKVPEGHVFVMGDNRRNSSDSRYWGFVPMGLIKGKAMFIWMSWDGGKAWGEFWKKIRWGRLFRGVHRELE